MCVECEVRRVPCGFTRGRVGGRCTWVRSEEWVRTEVAHTAVGVGRRG